MIHCIRIKHFFLKKISKITVLSTGLKSQSHLFRQCRGLATLHETPYLNDRTRCKFSGSFPQGKPFMNMDTQSFVWVRTGGLPTRGPFLVASPLFEGPCDLTSARVLCYCFSHQNCRWPLLHLHCKVKSYQR